jgi:hypothetical protein
MEVHDNKEEKAPEQTGQHKANLTDRDWVYEARSMILFKEDEPNDLRAYLTEQRAAGNVFVAYCTNDPVLGKLDLAFFKTDFDVAEFCYENTTDRDFYISTSIDSIESELNRWMQIKDNVSALILLTDAKMSEADWHYQRATDYDRFQEGEKEVDEIKHLLSIINKSAGIEEAWALWDSYVPANTIPLPNFLIDKNISVMTEQELSLFEKQLMKIGLKEAFTPELIEKLKSGVPTIEHPFKKSYDGDEASAILHINKSEKSDHYFFNKFDLSVRKDGQASDVKQTFHINNFKRKPDDEHASKFYTTFTFKEAFNYLSGRPVWKSFSNANDQQYNAWAVADFKNKQDNGSPGHKQYNQNYPFDLEKVMGNYSIKERANDTYKERLMQSVQRGNLQLATFVGNDGKEQKLFVSPNIPLNALRVYDANKQIVPTETLVEKGFIGKEFAEKLKENIEQIKQKNGSETRQQQAPVQENKGAEKQGLAKEEKEGETAGKENRQKQANKESQKEKSPRQKNKQKIH